MATVAEQVLAAGGEAGVQVEATGSAAGADAGLRFQFVERDENRGAVVMLGESTGDDAD